MDIFKFFLFFLECMYKKKYFFGLTNNDVNIFQASVLIQYHWTQNSDYELLRIFYFHWLKLGSFLRGHFFLISDDNINKKTKYPQSDNVSCTTFEYSALLPWNILIEYQTTNKLSFKRILNISVNIIWL